MPTSKGSEETVKRAYIFSEEEGIDDKIISVIKKIIRTTLSRNLLAPALSAKLEAL